MAISDESTGLKPKLFDPLLSPYLHAAGTAAAWGYAAAFVGVTLLALGGCILARGPADRPVTESIPPTNPSD